MEGHCPNEKDKINGAEYFLLYYIFRINGVKLNPGTIILKKGNLFYFFSPDDEDIYRSVFGETSTILTKDEENDLLSDCFIGDEKIIINNTTHTIKCILIDNVDPDGIPDFTGYLKCEDDKGNSKIIKIKDLLKYFFKQAGGRHLRGARHFRSRKRTSKRKTKSRRKKRAF